MSSAPLNNSGLPSKDNEKTSILNSNQEAESISSPSQQSGYPISSKTTASNDLPINVKTTQRVPFTSIEEGNEEEQPLLKEESTVEKSAKGNQTEKRTLGRKLSKDETSLRRRSVTHVPPLVFTDPAKREEARSELGKTSIGGNSGKHSRNAVENVRSSVKTSTLHWATNDMLQQDMILQDIEKHDAAATVDSSKLGPQKGTIAQELPTTRNRSASIVGGGPGGEGGHGDADLNYLTYRGAYFQKLRTLCDATIPKIYRRFSLYFILAFLLSLLTVGQTIDHPVSWFTVLLQLIIIDIGAAFADHAFFIFVIDVLFQHRFNVAYLLRSFNGPLGLFVTAFFAGSYFDDSAPVHMYPLWHRIVTAMVISLMFMCLKNWYIRKRYIAVLEKRFTDKLYQLETWNIILTELSSRKPPKTIKRTEFLVESGGEEEEEEENEYGSPKKSPCRPPPLLTPTRQRSISSCKPPVSYQATVPGLENQEKRVQNVFNDLAAATLKKAYISEEDQKLAEQVKTTLMESEKSSSDGSTVSITGGRKVATSHEEKIRNLNRLKKRLRERRTFWDLAARISTNAGALGIITYNGPVVIRKKSEAKDFGHLLFQHLSRGNEYVITHELFEELFCPSAMLLAEQMQKRKERKERARSPPPVGAQTKIPSFYQKEQIRHVNRLPSVNNEDNEDKLLHSHDKYAAIAAVLSSKKSRKKAHTSGRLGEEDYEDYEDKSLGDAEALLYKTAIDLFDPFKIGYVTQEQCMAAVCLVYKENRYAATSLNDYGELHKSLQTVVDVFFWLFILVLLEAFFKVRIYTTILLPFIAMGTSISFALFPSVGQVLVDLLFVFFMVPYEIGQKITIGVDPVTKITGWVRAIGILQTTVTTVKNETVRIQLMLCFLHLFFLFFPS
jgi:hypothetical protein